MLYKNSTVFFDYETSGLSAFYSQILSACFKGYDNQGIEIDNLITNCRIEETRLPEPQALIVNGHNPKDLNQAQPLTDMMKEIHHFTERFQESNFVAYNASFDFKFHSNSLYQTLVTPEWYKLKTKNRVVCAFEIMRSIYGFKEAMTSIKIPTTFFSTPKFSLEGIAAENGLQHKAHQAEGDVDVLKILYGLMINEAPEIVEQGIFCADKKNAKSVIQNSMFFCTNTGFDTHFMQRALLPIQFDIKGTSVLCVDLAQADPHAISSMSSWDIFNQAKGHATDNWIVNVPINKGKVFFEPEYASFCYNPGNLSAQELVKKIKIIKGSSIFRQTCSDAVNMLEAIFKNSDNTLESAIYSDGFCTPQEAMFINEFNSLDWNDRWTLAVSCKYLDPSNRIIRLAKKNIYDYDKSLIPHYLIEEYNYHINNKLFNLNTGKDVPWVNLPKVLDQLEKLKSKNVEPYKLKELKDYYESRSGSLVEA